MNYYLLVICVLIGLAAAVTLIPLLIRRSTTSGGGRGAHTFHHTHKQNVSRFGGIVFAVAFVVVTLMAMLLFPEDSEQTRTHVIVVGTSLAMFLLGLWDDYRPLGARKKLLGQLLIAMIVCSQGICIENFTSPFTRETHSLGWLSWPVTIVWLVGLTNMINLIDGMDGLAAGVSLMLMALVTFVGASGGAIMPVMVSASMCGALLGFLRYNFPPARIYMGDSGAYFLGFLIGMLTLVNSQKGTIVAALVAPLFALALPILDVSLAIARRGLKGLPIFRPDQGHIHHKLVQMGFSRTRAVLLLYGLSSVFLLIAFAVFWSQGRWVPILFGVACLVLLLAARSFEFSRKWFSVGRALESSIVLRKESQYALTVSRWLELEAERVSSVQELWADLVFMLEKIGFTQATLQLEDGRHEWSSVRNAEVGRRVCRTHELGGEHRGSIEFCADGDVMSSDLFAHVCELCAEAWHNAATRWQAVNDLPVRFDSRVERQHGSKVTGPQPGVGVKISGSTPPA